MLPDLRDTGALEQDSDVVLFIYREEMYDADAPRQHIADIIVRKHRNGPTGTVELFFLNRLAQFLDAETRVQADVAVGVA